MKKFTLLLMLLFCAGASQAQTQPDTLSNKAFGIYFNAKHTAATLVPTGK